MSINEQSIQEVLKAVVDANTGKDLVSSRSVKNIKVTGSDVSLDVELGYPAKSQVESTQPALRNSRSVAGQEAAHLLRNEPRSGHRR